MDRTKFCEIEADLMLKAITIFKTIADSPGAYPEAEKIKEIFIDSLQTDPIITTEAEIARMETYLELMEYFIKDPKK